MPRMSLVDQFKSALRHHANTVHVISSAGMERRHAMTATAVGSMSIEPASMYVSVNCKTGLHELLQAGHPFAINTLSDQQQVVAQACSQPPTGDARFSIGEWNTWKDTDLPLLRDTVSSIVCKPEATLRFTTHTLFVGTVMDVICPDHPGSVLTYQNSRYSRC